MNASEQETDRVTDRRGEEPMKKIKIFVGILGMDQHELGAIAVAQMLRDAGMEVIYGGRFNVPATVVKTSLEEDLDVIGLSCHSWEYLHYLPDMFKMMKDKKIDVPVIVGGSVITPGDKARLLEMGVAAAFPSGARNEEIIDTVRNLAQ
jgi:methylmalonyl-CoA mutase C-terminal domain/subunit